MHGPWPAALLASLLLAGCAVEPLDGPTATTSPTGPGSPCPLPAVDLSGTVTEVRPQSLLVEARGRLEGPVVLSFGEGTELLLRDGLSCRPGTLADVRGGDAFEAVADGPVMESYPPQTEPSLVVVDRRL